MAKREYPEHDKLKALDGANTHVSAFIDWLRDEKHYVICESTKHDDPPWVPVGRSPSSLLAEHFGIDEDKLEAEKRQMLDDIRAQNKEK